MNTLAEGYKAFIPAPLPPNPAPELEAGLINCGFPIASKYIEQFVKDGILIVANHTGQSRNRRFRYDPYLSLFESPDFAPFMPVEGAGETLETPGTEKELS